MAFVVSVSTSSYKESVSANFLPEVTSTELIIKLIIANALERNQGTGENPLKASTAVGDSSGTRQAHASAAFPASPLNNRRKQLGKLLNSSCIR